jgi:hypothetical protein
MMSRAQTRVAETQNKAKLVRQPEEKPALQHAQLPVQAVASQVAYRRVQVNGNGLTAEDLLALQRAVGNSQVHRMVARRIDHANGQPQDARWQLARQSQTSTIV